MVMNLQYFGGRGGASSLLNEKPVSKLMAKVYFNSAKKSDALRSDYKVQADSRLEKIIRNEDTDYIKSIDTKNEMHEFSKKIEAASNVQERHAQMETTTYQRARNRRIKNFDDWFNGGKR